MVVHLTDNEYNELPRLSKTVVPKIPESAQLPKFDINALRSGILHLGCGAFHRAHQAAITQEAVNLSPQEQVAWGIETVCMNRRTLYDTLHEQDKLFSLLLREPEKTTAELIGIFTEVLHAPSDPVGIHRRIAHPDIKIVTLAVTPGGYSINTETHKLNDSDPKIQEDLRNRDNPQTTIGMISAALGLVKKNGQRPPVFLSCDNIRSNGHTLHDAIVDYTALYDESLASWIDTNVQFPCAVVDRIAQPETEDDLHLAGQLLGARDLAPVPTEPLWDWTIEDFEGPRPLWQELGVRFVSNIQAYELGKLRLLNAAHMLLAYLGVLSGYDTIADSANDPLLGALTRQFMVAEAGSTLKLSQKDLVDTANTVLRRFTNPAIRQDIVRIGRNGSEKMIPRVTDAMRENLERGKHTPAGLLLIAAWIHGFLLTARGKHPVKLVEPMLDELSQLAEKNSSSSEALADAFLARTDLLGNLNYPGVREDLVEDLEAFKHNNVSEIVKHHLRPEFGGRVK